MDRLERLMASGRINAIDPYASSVFSSSFASVEQFNPQRYYAESGVVSGALPTGTTGPPAAAPQPANMQMYIIFGIIGVIIWALERHKLKIFGKG